MNNFAAVFAAQLMAKPDRSPSDDAILGILNAPDSARKKRQVNRMERHARRHLGFSDKENVDWASAIDWSKAIDKLLQFLALILPMLLKL